MKAKLIKRGHDSYRLYVDSTPYATTDNSPYKRLSLKNCQAIERGYDLDELAKEEFPLLDESRCRTGAVHEENLQLLGHRNLFQKGFQKALELLGDKKFSEEDMKSFAQNYYREIRENTSNLLWDDLADKCMKEHIQSLQQTEWDVEIKMVPAMSNNGNVYYGDIPKLDADGCLILKKV